MNNPRVYVGTYGKYNNGSLKGGWISLNDCKDYQGFLSKCRALHKGEHDPEYMIQDRENFPDGLNCGDWLSEEDFNDIRQACTDGPIIRFVDYSERSFALVGDTKPMKDALKKLGGTWNKRLSCGAGWIFSIAKREAVEAFVSSGEIQNSKNQNSKSKPAEKINDKALFEDYMKEWQKVWKNDESMLDYERKQFNYAVRLENGGIVYFSKPSIKTEFCFGYSTCGQGAEYDEASSACRAAKSEDYFLRANLDDMDETIKALECNCRYDHEKGEWNRRYDGMTWYIVRQEYHSQKEPVNLYEFHAYRECDVESEPWRYNKENCTKMSDADRKTILAAMKHERGKFEKRLQTYLKRYGTSKLRTWTYWVDE